MPSRAEIVVFLMLAIVLIAMPVGMVASAQANSIAPVAKAQPVALVATAQVVSDPCFKNMEFVNVNYLRNGDCHYAIWFDGSQPGEKYLKFTLDTSYSDTHAETSLTVCQGKAGTSFSNGIQVKINDKASKLQQLTTGSGFLNNGCLKFYDLKSGDKVEISAINSPTPSYDVVFTTTKFASTATPAQ